MSSREFASLKKNVEILKRQFLTFGKRTDGSYTRYELMQCRAFIAFCHAEVEIYLEEMCSRVVEKAEKHWRRSNRATNAIAAMLAYRVIKNFTLPDNPAEQGSRSKFETLVGIAISAQKSAIKRNHGIKPKNLAELFIPIGLKPEKFENSLLIQLKNLGERRGEQVHLNSQVSLPNIRDPFDDELRDIEFLVAEIEPFDALVRQLK